MRGCISPGISRRWCFSKKNDGLTRFEFAGGGEGESTVFFSAPLARSKIFLLPQMKKTLPANENFLQVPAMKVKIFHLRYENFLARPWRADPVGAPAR